jgi:hypothetical protein
LFNASTNWRLEPSIPGASERVPEAWLVSIKDSGPLSDFDRLTLHQAVTIVALELLADGTWSGTGVLGPEAFAPAVAVALSLVCFKLVAPWGSPQGGGSQV